MCVSVPIVDASSVDAFDPVYLRLVVSVVAAGGGGSGGGSFLLNAFVYFANVVVGGELLNLFSLLIVAVLAVVVFAVV